MLVEGDGEGNERGNTPPLDRSTADARTAKALFVVKNGSPGTCARILYKLPLLMYQAYNAEGGWSLYTTPGPPVTLRRPGGGTGGTPWDTWASDPNDRLTPRQTFAHWDAPFISWLESKGYDVDYCTDLDIDADTNLELLSAYGLLLSVGHDEYWSGPMRDHVESFVARGGNVAFFSGNTCWWQITFDDATTIRRPHNWFDPAGPNRPENALTGVSYRNAGGDWNSAGRVSVGYSVQHSDHWLFDGTGLDDGSVFGLDQQLVGYECDGTNFDRQSALPHTPAGNDGTPPEFVILAVGDVSLFGNNGNGEALGNKAATMGTYTRGGTVFTAGTVDWSRVVGRELDPSAVTITHNVLQRLAGFDVVNVSAITGQRIGGPVTSWQTPDGPYTVEHLAGVDASGDLFVFFWSPRADWQAVNVSAISGQKLAGPVTSWQTPDGPYTVEHLAGVDASGDLFVFFWSPRADWQAVNVSAISGQKLAGPVTSWQTPDGPYTVEHLAGVDASGDLFVFFWSPRADWQAVNVSAISGQKLAGPVTSWQTPDGPYTVEHLAGVDASGDLFVFFWSPRADWQAVNVSAISGQKLAGPVTSWQTPDGPYTVEHLAGVDASGDLFVFFWSPRADWQAVNVTAISGQKLAGPVTSWQRSAGELNVERLAGLDESGNVWVASWSPSRNWCAINVSLYARSLCATSLTSWQTRDGERLVEHLAGVSNAGDLLVYYWS